MKVLSWAVLLCALLNFASQSTEGCRWDWRSSGAVLVSLEVSCKLKVDLENGYFRKGGIIIEAMLVIFTVQLPYALFLAAQAQG